MSPVAYLVVEPSVQAVQLVLGFPPLVGPAPLHLRKSLIDPADETSVIGVSQHLGARK